MLEILNSAEYAQILSLFSEKKAKKKEIVYSPDYADNKVLIVKKRPGAGLPDVKWQRIYAIDSGTRGGFYNTYQSFYAMLG